MADPEEDDPPAYLKWPPDGGLPVLRLNRETNLQTAFVTVSKKWLFGTKNVPVKAFEGAFTGQGREFYQDLTNRVRYAGRFQDGRRHGVGNEYGNEPKPGVKERKPKKGQCLYGPLLFRGVFRNGDRCGIGADYDKVTQKVTRRGVFSGDQCVLVEVVQKVKKASAGEVSQLLAEGVAVRQAGRDSICDVTVVDLRKIPFLLKHISAQAKDESEIPPLALLRSVHVASTSAFSVARHTVRRAVRCLAILDHRNVIRPYAWYAERGSGRERPKCGYVVESYSTTVADLMEKLPPPVSSSSSSGVGSTLWNVKVCLQVAQGVKKLHQIAIVHRDLRWNAIAVMSEKTDLSSIHCRVARFDCAKEDMFLTSTQADPLDEMIGCVDYMAPEVLRGNSYDKAVDSYSFSMMLYCLFWRKESPYDGLSLCPVCKEPLESKSTSIKGHLLRCELRPDAEDWEDHGIPEALFTMMKKGWSSKSYERPSFADIVDVLDPPSESEGEGEDDE